ncbi:MAG TPA: hypothetical protein VNK41_08035 [Vicinamibacterales bacterium]|nr:hypothetical protein [Vicinamibacterales bacterium]
MIERLLGAACAIAAAAAVVWGSSVPLTVNEAGGAVLRLAWAVRPERIETCRDLAPEELANVPAHMRRTRVCEGVAAEYRLVVTDAATGDVLVDRVTRAGGFRQDRRLYVFEELPIPAGPAAFDVRFERLTQGAAEHADEGDDEEAEDDEARERRDEDARRVSVPPRLSLKVQGSVGPNEVVLVTYDAQRRDLVVLRGAEESKGS